MGDFQAVRDVPLWGAFFALIGLLVRQALPWRKLSLDSEAQIRAEMKQRIDELKTEHRECIATLRSLEREIAGLRRQHIQEQISLINAIIESVDSPVLKTLLRSLESVQAALGRNVLQTQVEGVIPNGDDDAG